MQKILNFMVAPFWWSKYKNSIFGHFLTTNLAPPGGEIKFVFHRSKPTWPALSHAKNNFLDIFILAVSYSSAEAL